MARQRLDADRLAAAYERDGRRAARLLHAPHPRRAARRRPRGRDVRARLRAAPALRRRRDRPRRAGGMGLRHRAQRAARSPAPRARRAQGARAPGRPPTRARGRGARHGAHASRAGRGASCSSSRCWRSSRRRWPPATRSGPPTPCRCPTPRGRPARWLPGERARRSMSRRARSAASRAADGLGLRLRPGARGRRLPHGARRRGRGALRRRQPAPRPRREPERPRAAPRADLLRSGVGAHVGLRRAAGRGADGGRDQRGCAHPRRRDAGGPRCRRQGGLPAGMRVFVAVLDGPHDVPLVTARDAAGAALLVCREGRCAPPAQGGTP